MVASRRQQDPRTPEAISEIERALKSPTVAALEEVLQNFEFLMETPGPDRQKYRLAKSTLRRLKINEIRERESQAAAALAPKDPSEVSPFAKESYDAADFAFLSTQWEGLKWRLISMPGGAVKKPDSYYRLYGLMKQATLGDNDTPRPVWAEKGGIDFDGRAAWDSWTGNKGMKAEEAKVAFVQAFHELSGPKDLFSDTRGDILAKLAA